AGGAEQGVRHLGEDAGPVPGAGVAALGAAVVEVPQHGERLRHGVLGPAPGQVGDEADAAGVVLELAVVESLVLPFAGSSGGSPPRASTAGLSEAARRAASRVACIGRWHSVSCRLGPYSVRIGTTLALPRAAPAMRPLAPELPLRDQIQINAT